MTTRYSDRRAGDAGLSGLSRKGRGSSPSGIKRSGKKSGKKSGGRHDNGHSRRRDDVWAAPGNEQPSGPHSRSSSRSSRSSSRYHHRHHPLGGEGGGGGPPTSSGGGNYSPPFSFHSSRVPPAPDDEHGRSGPRPRSRRHSPRGRGRGRDADEPGSGAMASAAGAGGAGGEPDDERLGDESWPPEGDHFGWTGGGDSEEEEEADDEKSSLARLYARYPRSVHAALAAGAVGATGALLGGAASYAGVDLREHAHRAAGSFRDYTTRQYDKMAGSDAGKSFAGLFRPAPLPTSPTPDPITHPTSLSFKRGFSPLSAAPEKNVASSRFPWLDSSWSPRSPRAVPGSAGRYSSSGVPPAGPVAAIGKVSLPERPGAGADVRRSWWASWPGPGPRSTGSVGAHPIPAAAPEDNTEVPPWWFRMGGYGGDET